MAEETGPYSDIVQLLNDIAFIEQQEPRGLRRVAHALIKARLFIIIIGLVLVPIGIFLETDVTTPAMVIGGMLLAVLGLLLHMVAFAKSHWRKGVEFYKELYATDEAEWDQWFYDNLPALKSWGRKYYKWGALILLIAGGISVLVYFFVYYIVVLSYLAFFLLLFISIPVFRRGRRIMRTLPKFETTAALEPAAASEADPGTDLEVDALAVEPGTYDEPFDTEVWGDADSVND